MGRAAACTSRATAATPGRRRPGNGLPPGIWGKVGVAIAPSDPHRIYAMIEADKGGLFQLHDGGDGLATVAPASTTGVVLLDPHREPDHAGRVVPASRCTIRRWRQDAQGHEGSRTATITTGGSIRKTRADDHGNDGGVILSTNGGETWTAPPLPISQFYHVSVDTRTPYHVAGAMQDLGTAHGPSLSRTGRLPWPTGTASAAARPATSSPIPAIRTSSMPANTSASSRATTIGPASRATSAHGRRILRATAARTCATASSGPRRLPPRRTIRKSSTTARRSCSGRPTAASRGT